MSPSTEAHDDDLDRFIQDQANQGFEGRRDKLVVHFAAAMARDEVVWPVRM